MHTPPELLARFVDGTLDEDVAVAVALHLDACPRCATRAASMEPLAPAFAAAEDPAVPPQLVRCILEEASAVPAVDPTQAGVQVSAVLLAASAGLLLLLGDPAGLVAELATLLGAVGTAAAALALSAQELGGTALLAGALVWVGAAGFGLRMVVPVHRALRS